MKPHLQYLWYVLRHKWFVFVECCSLGIPLQGGESPWRDVAGYGLLGAGADEREDGET